MRPQRSPESSCKGRGAAQTRPSWKCQGESCCRCHTGEGLRTQFDPSLGPVTVPAEPRHSLGSSRTGWRKVPEDPAPPHSCRPPLLLALQVPISVQRGTRAAAPGCSSPTPAVRRFTPPPPPNHSLSSLLRARSPRPKCIVLARAGHGGGCNSALLQPPGAPWRRKQRPPPKQLRLHLGSLDLRALPSGPRAGGAPGHPLRAGWRRKRRRKKTWTGSRYPTQNTWLRCCHFSLRSGEPGRAMGGCEVWEFLLQFGFFLPLLTAWPGYCSHVSNNQGKGLGREAGGGGCFEDRFSEDRCIGRLLQVGNFVQG